MPALPLPTTTEEAEPSGEEEREPGEEKEAGGEEEEEEKDLDGAEDGEEKEASSEEPSEEVATPAAVPESESRAAAVAEVDVGGGGEDDYEEEREEDVAAGLSPSERRLAKGMTKQLWGPNAPLLDTITGHATATSLQAVIPMPTMKKRKGKKRDTIRAPALERILGYTGDDAAAAFEESSSEEEDVDVLGGDNADKDDGMVDRDAIKLRAMKISARAQAQKARMAS